MRERGLRLGVISLIAAAAIPAAHVAAAELSDAANSSAISRNPAPIDPARSGNPLWMVPLGNLSITRERPLFSASRRAPAPPAVAAAVATPPPAVPVAALPERPALVLIGTIIGPSLQTGVFRDESSDRVVTLSAGGQREGWTLRSVSRSDAHFEMAERTAVLPLRPSAQPQGKSASPTTRPSRRREWYDN